RSKSRVGFPCRISLADFALLGRRLLLRSYPMELPDRRVKAIFDDALEIGSPGERAAYLDKACAAVPELRQKVEALLKAFAEAGSFLKPPDENADATTHVAPCHVAGA